MSRESVPFNGQKMRSDCSNYVSKLWISGNIMLPRKFFPWTRKLPCIFATLFVFSLNAWGWVIPYEGCSTSFLCFSQHTLSPYTETLTVEIKNWIRFHHNGVQILILATKWHFIALTATRNILTSLPWFLCLHCYELEYARSYLKSAFKYLNNYGSFLTIWFSMS